MSSSSLARTSSRRRSFRSIAGAMAVTVVTLLGAAGTAASAATIELPAPPREIVNLSSSATLEVARDLMTITFSTTREGADAGLVQAQLKQALEAALAEARRAARPGQVDVRTGNFALTPRYVKGAIDGWQGSAELVVEGRDLAAIGQLAGRIGSLTVRSVGYGLSRELRERSEGEVASQAIARFRAKAADYAKQFGYAGYTLGEVQVSSVDPEPPMPKFAMRAMAAAAPAGDALPVEAGKGSLTVTVSGTVQLTR